MVTRTRRKQQGGVSDGTQVLPDLRIGCRVFSIMSALSGLRTRNAETVGGKTTVCSRLVSEFTLSLPNGRFGTRIGRNKIMSPLCVLQRDGQVSK